MKIKKLAISDFRLIKNINLAIDENQIIIVGDNATGKTSIVESIYYACFLTSFRSNKRQELINFDGQIASIKVKYQKHDSENNLKIYFDSEKQNILYNEVVCKSRLDVLGDLKVLMLSPEFDEYVSGSPKIRRKFLNMHISQYDKEYSYYLAKYQKLTKQRNALFKSNSVNMELLLVITDEYDKLITLIRNKRKNFLSLVATYGSSIVSLLSLNQDNMQLEYSESNKVDINKEVLYKKSLYGLQYDDFLIKINQKEAKKYASQGQRRTISIALVLSQLEMIKEQILEYPIVIIDDVHIELDEKRQKILFEILDNDIQVFFISATKSSIPLYLQDKAKVIMATDKGEFN